MGVAACACNPQTERWRQSKEGSSELQFLQQLCLKNKVNIHRGRHLTLTNLISGFHNKNTHSYTTHLHTTYSYNTHSHNTHTLTQHTLTCTHTTHTHTQHTHTTLTQHTYTCTHTQNTQHTYTYTHTTQAHMYAHTYNIHTLTKNGGLRQRSSIQSHP